jgi:hypothetical protein
MNNHWWPLLILLTGCLPWTSLHADYGVVLGSYSQRDIAIRELRELEPSPAPLFIAVAQPAGDTHYRVIAGPYSRYGDAADALAMWHGRGLTDAWIRQMEIPAQLIDRAAAVDDSP